MELRRENIIAGDGRDKGIRVARRGSRQRRQRGLAIEAVHEIEASAVGDALPQGMVGELPHLVPPHVRDLESLRLGQRTYAARQQGETRCITLVTALEQHLLADA